MKFSMSLLLAALEQCGAAGSGRMTEVPSRRSDGGTVTTGGGALHDDAGAGPGLAERPEPERENKSGDENAESHGMVPGLLPDDSVLPLTRYP